jgi:hypothetical protein
MVECWDNTGLRSDMLVDGQSLRSISRFTNGGKVECLAASPESVRGPHQPNLILDEIDEVEWQLYMTALGQLVAKFGKPTSKIITSTMHHVGGSMERIVEENEIKPIHKLYKYCVWEVLSPCLDYNCSTCPLVTYCPGKQMKEADGYYSMETLIDRLSDTDEQTLRSEWFCQRPSMKGLVFEHAYKDDLLIDIDHPQPDWGFPELEVDFGYSEGHAFAINVVYTVPPGFIPGTMEPVDIQVYEVYEENMTTAKIIEICKHQPWYRKRLKTYCDNARPDAIVESNSLAGWDAFGVKKVSVHDRNNLVRSQLRPAKGMPKRYFSKRNCPNTVREFMLYKYNEKTREPVDRDNHSISAMGYRYTEKMREGTSKTSIKARIVGGTSSNPYR